MSNFTCPTAIDTSALVPYAATIDTTGSGTSPITPPCGSGGGAKAAWFYYRQNSGFYQLCSINTAGSDYFNEISVWTGTGCSSLTTVVCENSANSSSVDPKDIFTSFAAVSGTSYWILVTDEGTGTGGSLVISIDALTLNGSLVTSATPSLNAAAGALLAFSPSTGDLQIGDASLDIPPKRLTIRRSDGVVFSQDHSTPSIKTFAPSLGLLSSTTITAPATTDIGGIWFAPSGNLFTQWNGTGGNLGHVTLQERDPTTYAVLTTWTDVLTPNGASFQSGAFSPDGTLFYFARFGGTAAGQNILSTLTLSSSATATFATYGSWSGGANPTGNSFNSGVFRTTAAGQLVVATFHETTGTIDGTELLVYASNGTLEHHWPVTLAGSETVTGLELTDDDTGIWVMTTPGECRLYDLATGAVLIAGSGYTAGGLLDLIRLNGQANPPTPAAPGTEVVYPIRRVRQAPHLADTQGRHRLTYHGFQLIVESGAPRDDHAAPLSFTLQWSDDGGHLWSNLHTITGSKIGQYRYRFWWQRLGQSRDRCFRSINSDAAKIVLVDALLEPDPTEAAH